MQSGIFFLVVFSSFILTIVTDLTALLTCGLNIFSYFFHYLFSLSKTLYKLLQQLL